MGPQPGGSDIVSLVHLFVRAFVEVTSAFREARRPAARTNRPHSLKGHEQIAGRPRQADRSVT